MTIETLVVVFGIASVVMLLVRLWSGFSLTGCLTSYVLALLGAVGGWWVQQQYLVPDTWVVIPWGGRQVPVSVLGAAIGSLVLALLGRGWGQPLRTPRRRRRYR